MPTIEDIIACEQAFGRAWNYFFPKQRACLQAKDITTRMANAKWFTKLGANGGYWQMNK